ncbi:MAG TPA: hypothetical protein VGV85_04845 [Longimicrobiaceae bacterium]|nr:hypothetical protein [Longimicrobiaceae bacterium]
MPADSLESLRALRERIASLQVTRCRMFHERVRVENGAALRVSRGEPEPSLVRIGLCSPEARARNLACGHTMARYVLLDAVRALHAAGRLPEAAHDPLEQALESVCNAIHLLDHQKGDAERRLALSSERKHRSRGEAAEEEAASEAALSAAEVRRLEEQHDAYAGQIRELQGAVLAHLDAAIAGGGVRGG